MLENTRNRICKFFLKEWQIRIAQQLCGELSNLKNASRVDVNREGRLSLSRGSFRLEKVAEAVDETSQLVFVTRDLVVGGTCFAAKHKMDAKDGEGKLDKRHDWRLKLDGGSFSILNVLERRGCQIIRGWNEKEHESGCVLEPHARKYIRDGGECVGYDWNNVFKQGVDLVEKKLKEFEQNGES